MDEPEATALRPAERSTAAAGSKWDKISASGSLGSSAQPIQRLGREGAVSLPRHGGPVQHCATPDGEMELIASSAWFRSLSLPWQWAEKSANRQGPRLQSPAQWPV